MALKASIFTILPFAEKGDRQGMDMWGQGSQTLSLEKFYGSLWFKRGKGNTTKAISTSETISNKARNMIHCTTTLPHLNIHLHLYFNNSWPSHETDFACCAKTTLQLPSLQGTPKRGQRKGHSPKRRYFR